MGVRPRPSIRLPRCLNQLFFQSGSLGLPTWDWTAAAKGFGYALLVLSTWLVFYTGMRIAQLPWPMHMDSSASEKGMTLYSSQELQSTYTLFGSKPVDLSNIQLRGVVITGQTQTGQDSGFALLEIDGKPTGAVGLGENLGRGFVLHAIRSDGATLIHQGQKIDLTLATNSPKRNATPSRPTTPNSSNGPSSPPAGAAPPAPEVNKPNS